MKAPALPVFRCYLGFVPLARFNPPCSIIKAEVQVCFAFLKKTDIRHQGELITDVLLSDFLPIRVAHTFLNSFPSILNGAVECIWSASSNCRTVTCRMTWSISPALDINLVFPQRQISLLGRGAYLPVLRARVAISFIIRIHQAYVRVVRSLKRCCQDVLNPAVEQSNCARV